MQKTTQVFVFSFIVIALFATSLLVFFNTYEKYRVAKSNSAMVEQHYADLLFKKQKIEKIRGYANLANKVNNAIEKLNYTPNNWTDYQVNLDKGLNFPELNYILNQTQHGKGYFFIPDKLEITLPVKSALLEQKKIDAHLKLQGRYLVKQW